MGRADRANHTYVSYELDSKNEYALLMVHDLWEDVNRTYGEGTEKMNARVVWDNDSYVQHTRVKDVYIRRFDTMRDIEALQDLCDVARERLGESRAAELRKLMDLKNASRGLYVSKTGKLPDNGGLSGRDYEEFSSVNRAFEGRLPGACKIDGKTHHYTYRSIVKLVAENEGKPLFIPASRKGNVLKHGDYNGKKGFVIQFSPFLFPRDCHVSVGTRTKYLYFPEWDLVYHT